MTIWNYIGFVSGFTCILIPLGDSMLSSNKKRARVAAVAFVAAMILFLAAVFWPNMSDSIFNPASEEVFTLNTSDNLMEVTVYQEESTGEYYLLSTNETDMIRPTYRHYLDAAEAKAYIEEYNAITTVQDELVDNINKIINP